MFYKITDSHLEFYYKQISHKNFFSFSELFTAIIIIIIMITMITMATTTDTMEVIVTIIL